jgi:methyl-accepting chemotaxis protein
MKLKQSTVTLASAVAFALIGVLLVVGVLMARSAVGRAERAVERQIAYREIGRDLTRASDLLTNEARAYSVSASGDHLAAYWREIDVTKTRERALARLKRLGVSADELALVEQAKRNSDALVRTEARSQRLVLEALQTPEAKMPAAIAATKLAPDDEALAVDEKLAAARSIMFDAQYTADKAKIAKPMARFQQLLNDRASAEAVAARASAKRWMNVLVGLSIVLVALLGGVLWIFHSRVGRVVERYSRALAGRDPGDRTFRLEAAGVEELVGLADRFNAQLEENGRRLDDNDRLLGDLRVLVEKVTETTTSVSASSQQMATTSEEAGRAVGEIATAVSEVASGSERQVRMIEETRGATEATGEAADRTSELSREGVRAAEQANASMQRLRESTEQISGAIRDLAAKSERIGGIVETITGIAGQTNLLALNAAIEAARAGEQGRGFAVVAEEVRKLAEESQQAAATIAALVGEIQGDTERTVQVVEEGAQLAEESTHTVQAARDAFEQIGSSVEDMRDRIARVVSSTVEIAAVAEQSSASAEEVSASTQETTASAQQIAAVARELAHAAEELDGLVHQFELA